jgi:dethiobiotin synthetase/adenosylmethionine--8-amino-7-oxononanoate aminotransferase
MYIETAGGKVISVIEYLSANRIPRILGVHSPTLSGLTQVDAYRDLLLPTILIGDSRLGGISSTISAFESLHIRGYTIDQIILFSDTYYRNWEYLTEFFREKGIDVTAIPPPPQKLQDVRADREALEGYYRSISDGQESQASVALSVVNRLDDLHARRIETIQSMPGRAIDSFWYPFVQHGRIKSESDITVIDSAHGDFFSTYNASSSDQSPPPVVPEASKSMLQPRFDGSASWWTQAVGHADPSLTLAAAHAAGRYGHVIFPLAVHEPALALAERLIQNGPGKGWASRVFFSDNGTIGCELALKMALRASALRYGRRKELGVIGIRGSYHGDTIGAMDACDGGPFSAAVEWYRGRGFWFDPPQIGIRNGQAVVSCTSDTWKRGDFDVDDRSHVKWGGSNGANSWHHTTSSLSELYDVESRLSSPLARIYRRHICKTLERLIDEGLAFGALIIEPLVMGAAGMIFVDPLFQRVLVDVVRESEDLFSRNNTLRQSSPTPSGAEWTGLPIIFDEVFVGLYRLGHMTCSSVLGTRPDVSVLAKILTGGLLPMAVTLSSSSIFNAFLGPDKIDALLHGHSYTAHPIGCAVANAALDITEGISQGDAWSEAKRKWESKPWVRGTKNSHPLNAWSLWDADFVNDISRLGGIQEVMTLGTVLAIRLEDSTTGMFLPLITELSVVTERISTQAI